jgi:hypothetical protein
LFQTSCVHVICNYAMLESRDVLRAGPYTSLRPKSIVMLKESYPLCFCFPTVALLGVLELHLGL